MRYTREGKWYVRVFEDNDTIHIGSDSACYSSYVRADCVRKLLENLSRFKKHGKYAVIEIYTITTKQFWDLDWQDIKVLRQHGKLVWSR